MTCDVLLCHHCGSGDRAAAVEAYKAVEQKAAGSGLKMDNVFTMLRCTRVAWSSPSSTCPLL